MRTDLPFMNQSDMENWIVNLVQNVHATDIQMIHNMLSKEIENYKRQLLKDKKFKMCDKCMLTYPFHTTKCESCGGEKLREFKTPVP